MIVRVGGVLLTAHAIAAEGQQAPITAKRVVDWKSGEGIIVRFAETTARLVPEFGRLQLDKPPYSEAAGFEMLTDHRATHYVQILSPLAAAAVEHRESIRTKGRPDFAAVQRALNSPIVQFSIRVETTYRPFALQDHVVMVAEGETIQPLSFEEGKMEIPWQTSSRPFTPFSSNSVLLWVNHVNATFDATKLTDKLHTGPVVIRSDGSRVELPERLHTMK
jgi:hypothetical protein